MLTVRGTDIEKTKNMGSKTILRIRALLCGGGGAGSWSGRMVKLFTVEPGGPTVCWRRSRGRPLWWGKCRAALGNDSYVPGVSP